MICTVGFAALEINAIVHVMIGKAHLGVTWRGWLEQPAMAADDDTHASDGESRDTERAQGGECGGGGWRGRRRVQRR